MDWLSSALHVNLFRIHNYKNQNLSPYKEYPQNIEIYLID